MPRPIDGSTVLYHYFQKVIIPREDDFSREVVRRLILDLAIWFPADFFSAVPVLLPFCVRDSTIKSKEWGSANAEGCLRDNNSALKLLVAHYPVVSPRPTVYPRSTRGHGFVASHVWRRIRIDGRSQYATTHPRTYSFVPNLAWLPAQIARLTDHEGSYAQQVLQAVSHMLYGAAASQHPPALAAIWQALPAPALELGVDLAQLNYFSVSARAINTRRALLLREIGLVEEAALSGIPGPVSPRSSRYLPSLALLALEQTAGLLAWLGEYRAFLKG